MTTFPLLPYFINIEARRRAAEEDARRSRDVAAKENAATAEQGRGQAIIAAQIAKREQLLRLQASVNDLGETVQIYDDPDSVLRASVNEARRVRTRQIWQWIAVGLLLPLEICFVTPHLVDLFMGKVTTLLESEESLTWLRLLLCLFVSAIVLLLSLGAKRSGRVSTQVGCMVILTLAFAGAYYTDVRFEAANIVPTEKEYSISIADTKPDQEPSSGTNESLSAAALTALPNAIFYLFALAIHGSLVFGSARALSPEEKELLSFDRPAVGEQLTESRIQREELGRQMRSEILNAPIELRDRMLLESMRVADIINDACGEEAIQIPGRVAAAVATPGTDTVQTATLDGMGQSFNNADTPSRNYDTMVNVEDVIFG